MTSGPLFMASIFGYQLGVLLPGSGYNPSETENTEDPGAFSVGSNIELFMSVQSGETLKNKAGDTFTFGRKRASTNVIEFETCEVTISSGPYAGTYVFDDNNNFRVNIYLGMVNGTLGYRVGSYAFTVVDTNGYLRIGTPTRVSNKANNEYLASNVRDSCIAIHPDGTMDFINGHFSVDYFTLFLARELIGGGDPEPDSPGGDIDIGGGLPGGYDPDSDEIPWDVTNWLSASDLGMCTVYNPSVSQVKALATRLYSKDFQSGFENYIWGNPIESIIGLSVFPCQIPNGGAATVKSWGLDTGVTMTLAGSTLIHVNCGSLPVPSAYEGYLDYSPYTQAEVYIPYVGFVGLDADDIMGQTLQLHYYVDIISGSATVKLVISNTSTTTVLGQWSCQVGRQIPIGSKDYNDIINAGVQLVASAITAYSGNVIPEIVTDYVNDAGEVEARGYEGGGFNTARFATQMLRAGSSAIMQAKPNITRGSAIASASGQLAVQYPYLILKRPVSAKTNGYGALIGYPTFKYGEIGAYSGFVRCQNIKLDGVGCTDWELSEIFRLCLEGVYI